MAGVLSFGWLLSLFLVVDTHKIAGHVAGTFSEKRFRAFWPRGAIKKNKEKAHTSHTHTVTALANVRFDTGDTEVAGVGIADGSCAKHDVDIRP